VVDSQRDGSLGATGIASAFALAVMVMVHAIGHLSGAHINPALTAAFAATRHFPARDALAYVPAQLGGVVAAALLLRYAWEGTPADLGATVPTVDRGPECFYELGLTAFLMFVVVAVATDTRAVGAAACALVRPGARPSSGSTSWRR
jgi:glycerol uptake facilitator-like aquaporin